MATPTLSDSVEAHVDSEERVDSADESGNIFDATISGEIPGPAENKASSPVMEGISDATLDDVQDPRKASGETNTSPLALQSTDSQKAQLDGRLIDAASEGDLGALKKTIEEGANITFKGPGSETALHRACRSGHRHIVEELLNHEETLKCLGEEDCDGWTPLISACSTDYLETKRIVELLLQHQQNDHFNIEATSDEGKTALHTACWESSKEVVELLLKNNALVDATDDHNCTPLTLACERPSPEIVQLLLENKAGCDAADNDGDTPLILACECGTTDMVAKILEYNPKSMSSRNNLGRGALGSAILNADTRDQIIPLLLNKGLEVDRKDASEIFPRVISDKVSGSHVEQSAWLKVVQEMMKSNNPKVDKPLTEALKPIWQFASEEEKVFAILNADNKEHFDILCGLTEELGLSKDICSLIWLSARDDVEATMFGPHVSALFKEMQSLKSAPIPSRLKPQSPLQWAAYYGDYTLVWYILKHSQMDNQENVSKALGIASARNPTRQSRSKIGTVLKKSNKGGKIMSKKLDPVEDFDKGKVDGNPYKYKLTINLLTNANSLVRSPNRRPMLPNPRDIEQKVPLLQQRFATVVSIYERGDHTELLKSSPCIFDLIYENDGEGVNAVMEMAKSTLDAMTNTRLDEQLPRSSLKFRWIHLPANNMDWMEHLTLRIYDAKHSGEEGLEGDKHLAAFMDLAQRSQHELPTDKSDFRFMKPLCLRERNESIPRENYLVSSKYASQYGSVEFPSPRLALYMPYVTLGYCNPETANAPYAKHKELPESYKGRVLHGPRSLDRFYYNTLSPPEMDERDQSQVVTRKLLGLEMGESPLRYSEEWPYLTVDQLWVWIIDNETIITSSTHRKDDFDALLLDKVWELLLQAREKGLGENLPSTVSEMSEFLVSTCVDFINNLTWKDVCGKNDKFVLRDAGLKPILLLYADAINEVAAHERDLYKSYQDRITHEETMAAMQSELERVAAEEMIRGEDKAHEQVAHVFNRLRGLGKSKKSWQEADRVDQLLHQLSEGKKYKKDWQETNRAAKLLDQVKDIRDELVILRFLVAQQERVWTGLMGIDQKGRDVRNPGFTANELDNMIKRTDTIQKSINYFSNVKQSMMSRDMLEKSAKQSEILVNLRRRAEDESAENAKQGKILYAFGFVTVVFTPLSFLTSLLALNTTTSRHNSDGELEYEASWMNRFIFGISAAIVGPFLIYAFFGGVMRGFAQIKKTYTRIAKSLRDHDRPESGKRGDEEKGQAARDRTIEPPSNTD